MKICLLFLAWFVTALPALADDAVVAAPKLETDPTALIICAVLFVVLIGGFAGWMWWKDRAGKTDGAK